MGADFIASWITWPKEKSHEDFYKEAKEKIEKITWDTLDDPDFFDSFIDEDDQETFQEDPKALREFLLGHLDEMFDTNRRDIGYGMAGDHNILLTGGMSWGDSPTEVFDSFNIVVTAVGELDMQKDAFTESEQTTLYEAARIALGDAETFDRLAEDLDIKDDHLTALREKLQTFMDNQG